MLNEEKMEVLNQQFQRIFTLPVTRLTFRELQSTISTAFDGNAAEMQSLIESLLMNNFPDDSNLEPFFQKYAVPFRVAKQIQDRGEVLSMLTTDVGTQGENLLFQVSIRRMDGGEFKFMSDAGGFLQIAEHIIDRLASTSSTLVGKGAINGLQPRLKSLEETVKKLSK
jgi:hypothetical protein